jgi:elongation factor Ts
MSKITAKKVSQLREKTGAGIMACKEALKETGGELDKAIEVIGDKAQKKAQKKKGEREVKSGLIDAYIHQGRIGVLLKVGTETDFVAKNKEVQELAHDLALQIASMNPEKIDDLLEQPFIKDQDSSVQEVVDQLIGKIGEKIEIIEFCRYEV